MEFHLDAPVRSGTMPARKTMHLAEYVGITEPNLSLLKQGKVIEA